MKTPGIAKTLSEFETQIDFVNTIPTDLVGNLYLLERKKMSRKSQKAFATCHGNLNRELLEAKKNQSSNVNNNLTIYYHNSEKCPHLNKSERWKVRKRTVATLYRKK